MGHARRHRDRTHPARQALAERHRRELQRPRARRCLSMEWFRTRQDAAAIIEGWRRHYERGATSQLLRTFDAGRIQEADTDNFIRPRRLLSEIPWSEEPRQVRIELHPVLAICFDVGRSPAKRSEFCREADLTTQFVFSAQIPQSDSSLRLRRRCHLLANCLVS